MSVRVSTPSALVLLLAASAAFAMSIEPPPPQPGVPSISGPGTTPVAPRLEAEQSYALAYEEVAKARRDLEQGKAKNAEKKFRRALERCERAVALDERYHEAWNLLGYCARKVGDFPRALKAYDRCLAIKPDYAPAREYLGEAWLDLGNAKKARDQLAWLERLGAAEELKTLKTRYDAWIAAHPDSAIAPAPARPDSAGAATGTAGH